MDEPAFSFRQDRFDFARLRGRLDSVEQVFENRAVEQEAVGADVAQASEQGFLALRQREGLAWSHAKPDRTGTGGNQSGHEVQEGGFACARRPENQERLAGVHSEGDTLEDRLRRSRICESQVDGFPSDLWQLPGSRLAHRRSEAPDAIRTMIGPPFGQNLQLGAVQLKLGGSVRQIRDRLNQPGEDVEIGNQLPSRHQVESGPEVSDPAKQDEADDLWSRRLEGDQLVVDQGVPEVGIDCLTGFRFFRSPRSVNADQEQVSDAGDKLSIHLGPFERQSLPGAPQGRIHFAST